jgi:hypothetical protein
MARIRHQLTTNATSNRSRTQSAEVSFSGAKIPLYGPVSSFARSGVSVLENELGEKIAYVTQLENKWFARIGYDIFHEVRTLLNQGSPPQTPPFQPSTTTYRFFGISLPVRTIAR